MIRAYHVIWGTYGFWLPNDPRGSWSDFVASWELLQHGKSTALTPREARTDEWASWRAAAVRSLRFPAVALTGAQARAVGTGFGKAVRKSGLTVLACAILPQHVHLVVGRHSYDIERVCIQLKGEATKELNRENLHPLAAHARTGKTPSLWQEGLWKVFLEEDANIRAAINYVEQNPIKEGKKSQRWSFVTPFH